MRLTLIQLTTFAAKWSKLGLTDEDLRSLEGLFLADPEAGDVIPGTGGLRKIRFAPPTWHTGKRGASRVIYAFIVGGEAVYSSRSTARTNRPICRPMKRSFSDRFSPA